MHSDITLPGDASTFLTLLFGSGLADERHVVERFKSMVDGDIRRVEPEAPTAGGRRKAKRTIVALEAVKLRSRPAFLLRRTCRRPGKALVGNLAPVYGPRGSQPSSIAPIPGVVAISEGVRWLPQLERAVGYSASFARYHPFASGGRFGGAATSTFESDF